MDEEISAAQHSHQRHKKMIRDVFNIALFVISVLIGAFLLNSFVFQSFNVEGPSMEQTMYTGDRLVVNKTIVSYSRLRGKDYIPERGQIIVFENPLLQAGSDIAERHLVKRVIGLPGERVKVENGSITVFNQTNPAGFNPDQGSLGPGQPTSGNIDIELSKDEIFVAGDHRVDSFSFDSRNGLGPVPLKNIEGPVYARIWPLSKFRVF